MAPEDTCYQRIFWREQPTHPLRILKLNTVTYGTASAPYQATRCLNLLAEEESPDFPIAARILKEDCYMDDILSGADTIEEAIEYQRQLKELLGRGCFPIHKWCSNSVEFLEHIPSEDREKHLTLQEYGANEAIKVLGLLWDPTHDMFLIAHQHRPVLAQIERQLWKTNAGWDDIVEEQFQRTCFTMQEALPQLNLIKVPRCITFPDAIGYEIHGFADASTVAYGACIYLRSMFTDGSARLRLISSKSKVAPLHELTIPRMELCAAQLLTRLLDKVIPATQMTFQEVVLWSDNTIVLAWMKKPLDRLQVFVRNRIAEIQKSTNGYKWCDVAYPYVVLSLLRYDQNFSEGTKVTIGSRTLLAATRSPVAGSANHRTVRQQQVSKVFH
ncbi:uncharacterized protein LOC131680208 [Topomyia yanbarensis]|uniref:uncharacterized protein LOC131680208 n=1 Tax=Topomyia yanbarensis TaxID=2498891 RepID=UPI00273B7C0D|nr:uncharacterized protein LOC131680208 [Topomyia yanbarensis]